MNSRLGQSIRLHIVLHGGPHACYGERASRAIVSVKGRRCGTRIGNAPLGRHIHNIYDDTGRSGQHGEDIFVLIPAKEAPRRHRHDDSRAGSPGEMRHVPRQRLDLAGREGEGGPDDKGIRGRGRSRGVRGRG